MSSRFGELFAVTTFGESHGPAVGVVVDGMPPGIAVDPALIQRELDRRRPGQSALTTQRAESDTVEILSGLFEGKGLGTPIAMLVRSPAPEAARRLADRIEAARDAKDSVGGVVEVMARGVPAGWGDPTMAKLDAMLGAAMLSIPATKGVEIGGGFEMAARAGSETNDVFDGGRFLTNHAGGIAGGISNGADVVVRVAVRPATSIGKPQTAATAAGGTTTIAIEGRHDPCICPRVVPVAESMLALVLMDAWLRQRALRGRER